MGATVPAAQAFGATLPDGLKKPGAVNVHSAALVRLVESECDPLGHGAGSVAATLQKAPLAHRSHAVCPAAAWYLPGSHLVQTSKPQPSDTVPAAHGVGATLPVGLKKPGPVDVQSAALVRLDELEYDPPGQGAGSTEPSTQNEPAMQSRQPTCPESGWRLPGSQRAHVALPLLGAALPGRQSWQTSVVLLPGMGLALPGGQARQDAWLALPVDGLYVPGGHGVYVWRTVAAPSAAQ